MTKQSYEKLPVSKWSKDLFLKDQITATEKQLKYLQNEIERLRLKQGLGRLFATQKMQAKMEQVEICEKHLVDLYKRLDLQRAKKIENDLAFNEIKDLFVKKFAREKA